MINLKREIKDLIHKESQKNPNFNEKSLYQKVTFCIDNGYKLNHENIADFLSVSTQLKCPKFIIDFLINLIKNFKNCKTLFDPKCEIGTFTLPIIKSFNFNKFCGLVSNQDYLNVIKYFGNRIGLDNCFYLNHNLSDIKENYDLVISFLPSSKYQSLSYSIDSNIKDCKNSIILLKSCMKLNQHGLGLFVVKNRFIANNNLNSVYKNLSKFNLYIKGIFYCSRQNIVLVISKEQIEKTFVGVFNGENQNILIANFIKEKNGKNSYLGKFIDINDFESLDSLLHKEKILSYKNKIDSPEIALEKITEKKILFNPQINDGFINIKNSIFFPLILKLQVLTNIPDEKQIKYIQIVLKEELVNSHYLKEFLNSEIGVAIRSIFYKSFRYKQDLVIEYLPKLQVFLPSLSCQLKIIDHQTKINNLFSELNEIKFKLWNNISNLANIDILLNKVNKEESFKGWLETLPFPLSTILFSYNTAVDDRKKYELLDLFFEALNEFIGIIFLSSLISDKDITNNILLKIKKDLYNQHLSIKRSTFGTWNTINSIISKYLRTLYNNGDIDRLKCYDLLKTNNNSFIETILSSKIISIFKETNTLRNNWRGHGGILGNREAKNRKIQLEAYLSEVRSIMGNIWNTYYLFKPINLEYPSDEFIITGEKMISYNSMFVTVPISMMSPLKTGSLYFVDDAYGNALKLLPFVNIVKVEDSDQHACYFFNKKLKDGYKYISYHFAAKNEIVREFDPEIEEVLELFEN